MYLGEPKSHIMIALDTISEEAAIRVMDRCADAVDNIKFNYPLILREGLNVIRRIKQRYGKPVVADFKVADVPVTNNRIARLAMEAEVDALMIHGFIGSDAIADLNQIAEGKMGIIIVTELTNPGGLQFTRKHAHDFAGLCSLLDCYGIQAPGTRPDQIAELRSIIGPEKVVISCGIGAQGGSFKEAIQSGADFGIIGRGIYDSPDPLTAAEDFARSLYD